MRGPNLDWSFFKREESLKLNLSLSIFNDMRPIFRFSSGEESLRNSRETALDLAVDFAYKFGFRNLFELGARVSRDFIEHRSLYFEPYFKSPVVPFVTLKLLMGFGEGGASRYLFGQGARSGPGHYGVGLNFFMPIKWLEKGFSKGFFLFSLDYTEVLQRENRTGELLEGKPDNLNFSLGYFTRLF